MDNIGNIPSLYPGESLFFNLAGQLFQKKEEPRVPFVQGLDASKLIHDSTKVAIIQILLFFSGKVQDVLPLPFFTKLNYLFVR